MAVRETKRKITDFTDVTDREIGNNAATNPSAYLRRISVAVHVGLVPQPSDMSQLGAALDLFLNGVAFDAAFGLKTKPGQRSWETRSAIDQRDHILREAAGRHYGGLSKAAQAQHLHVDLMRYSASAWERERICDECPDRHRGTINEFLWHALKRRDHALKARSIREILATS